jgi:PadR family transcriptional regulator PadR
MDDNKGVDSILLELRRGVVTLAVLSQLEQEQYGYSLLNLLEAQGMLVDQGTLYPLLRRLESQGLLESVWRIEDGRPRRYYVLSDSGRLALPRLIEEWSRLEAVMSTLINR